MNRRLFLRTLGLAAVAAAVPIQLPTIHIITPSPFVHQEYFGQFVYTWKELLCDNPRSVARWVDDFGVPFELSAAVERWQDDVRSLRA